MNRLLRSRVAAVVAGALVFVSLGYGVAVATGAITGSREPAAVKVCVTKKNVVVSASRTSACPKGTRRVAVGARGPRGPAGPQGMPGTTGIFGPSEGTPYDVDPGGTTGGTYDGCRMGQITLTAASYALGTPARGQILPISQNTALFSLLGNRFGGNGTTTFALPDLRDAAPQGLIYGICTQGVFPGKG